MPIVAPYLLETKNRIDMETKRCTKCGEVKELGLFSNNKSRKDGKQSECKECVRERARKYRLENPEKAREAERKWKRENPEKVREYGRKWYLKNPEKAREHDRKWRLKNPEKVREYGRKHGRKGRRELKTGYVKRILRAEFNIPTSEIIPLDIKEKREQLQYHRQIKLLTKQLKQNENKS